MVRPRSLARSLARTLERKLLLNKLRLPDLGRGPKIGLTTFVQNPTIGGDSRVVGRRAEFPPTGVTRPI